MIVVCSEYDADFDRQVEITEGLMNKSSSIHALSNLGSAFSKSEHKRGRLDKEEGSTAPSGTYAKPC